MLSLIGHYSWMSTGNTGTTPIKATGGGGSKKKKTKVQFGGVDVNLGQAFFLDYQTIGREQFNAKIAPICLKNDSKLTVGLQ